MEKYEDSWYNEDDTSQDEEDLDLNEEPIKPKNKMDFELTQCPNCEKVLSTKTALAIHLKSVRPCTIIAKPAKQEKKVYKSAQCPECNKVFTQKTNMMIHLKSTHQGIRLKCEYCSKTATNKSNLKKHIRLYCQSKPL